MGYVPSVTDVRTWGQRVAVIVADVHDDIADPAGATTLARGLRLVRIGGRRGGTGGAGGVAVASSRDGGAQGGPIGVAVP